MHTPLDPPVRLKYNAGMRTIEEIDAKIVKYQKTIAEDKKTFSKTVKWFWTFIITC